MHIELYRNLGRGSGPTSLRRLLNAAMPLAFACTSLACAQKQAVVPPGYALVPVAMVSKINPQNDCELTSPNGSRPNCLHRYWTGTVCVIGDKFDGCPCYQGRKCTNGHACKVVDNDKCICP